MCYCSRYSVLHAQCCDMALFSRVQVHRGKKGRKNAKKKKKQKAEDEADHV
jgi:hypothetical protein